MLYVTIVSGATRTARKGFDTDDPATAVAEAIKQLPLIEDGESAAVVGLVIERKGSRLSKIEVAEQLQSVRDAEVERGAR